MPAFERKLHRHAEGITILRTMAVTAQPPCRRFLESGNELRRTETVKPVGRLVLHEPPRQHLWIVLATGATAVPRGIWSCVSHGSRGRWGAKSKPRGSPGS